MQKPVALFSYPIMVTGPYSIPTSSSLTPSLKIGASTMSPPAPDDDGNIQCRVHIYHHSQKPQQIAYFDSTGYMGSLYYTICKYSMG